jgi:hypothetical protein
MKHRSLDLLSLLLAFATLTLAAGCSKRETTAEAKAPPPATSESHMKPVTGIQDIMATMIDPAADHLWESVATVANEKGVEEKRPKTDEDWKTVRSQAVILAEAANLLMVEGRPVAKEGAILEDHGVPGNLTAAESEQAIAADRATFIGFAEALREVGVKMLTAADRKDSQALFDAGYPLDEVCEACHLQFWYPGAKALEAQQRALRANQ